MRSHTKIICIVFCFLQISQCTSAQESNNETVTESLLDIAIEKETTAADISDATLSPTLETPAEESDGSGATTTESNFDQTQPEIVTENEGIAIETETTEEPSATTTDEITTPALDVSSVTEEVSKSPCDCETTGPTEPAPTDQDNTTTEPSVNQETTASHAGVNENGVPTSTILPGVDTDTTTEAEADTTQTTTSSNIGPTCTSIGNIPNDSDCHLYYSCTAEGVESEKQACPDRQAFNKEYGRCTRDISACADGILCEQAGTFPNPLSNASYYWCVAKLTGGFHKYHVQCRTNEIFIPELGKCFIDISNLPNLPPFSGLVEPDDEDIVKAELKQFKKEEKARLKEQKLKDKLEKKLQKELAKKAAKEAKEQAKLKEKEEIESFVCTQEGYFPSTVSTGQYYSCVNKKNIFKVVVMKCPKGSEFDQQSGTCTISTNIFNGSESDDGDDDDDDD